MSSQVQAYNADHSVGTIDKLTDVSRQQSEASSADHGYATQDYLEAEHQLALYTSSERILTAEIEAILAAVGGESTFGYFSRRLTVGKDDEGAHKPHTFKSSVFSIPTQCGYCKVSQGDLLGRW